MSGMEPILIGAAIGGASSAIQGGDVLEGAALGALGGGVGGAVTGGLGGAASAGTEAALSGAESFIPSVAETAGTEAFATPAAQVAMSELPGATGIAGLNTIPDYSNALGMAEQVAPPASQGIASVAPPVAPAPPTTPDSVWYAGNQGAAQPTPTQEPGMMDKAWGWAQKNPMQAGMLGLGAISMLSPQPKVPGSEPYQSSFDRNKFKPSLPQNAVYQPRYATGGGISNLSGSEDYENDGIYNSPVMMASGGISSLGGYSDGGRMLKGPGDGMSDSIPASIGGKQPARLADGEFIVPADVVSHLGNGSTDAGAKQLYAMMDKVRKARTGTKKQGRQINPGKFVPA